MKIAILGSNPELYSHKRMIEAAEVRGHTIDFINIKNCYMNISRNNPQVFYRGGEKLENYDAIIPRIRPALTFYGHYNCYHAKVSICRSPHSRIHLKTLKI